MINRRSLLIGLVAGVTAPAIIRAGNLMPVKLMLPMFRSPTNIGGTLNVWVGPNEMFKTISEGMNYVTKMDATDSVVFIAPGTYENERVFTPSGNHILQASNEGETKFVNSFFTHIEES